MASPETLAAAILDSKLSCPYCKKDINRFKILSIIRQDPAGEFSRLIGKEYETEISWFKGEDQYNTNKKVLREILSLKCGHCEHELPIQIVGKFLGINMVWRT